MKVSLVCIAKDEDNYIKEWIDYHKKLGFDDIFIYENNWDSNVNEENVHTIKMDGEIKQIESYNHFIKEYYSKYDWVAFIDVDEFITLKKHKDIKDFILEFGVNSIAMNWVIFGSNGHDTIVNNNYSVLDRFTKRQNSVNPHIKTLLKLESPGIRMLDPHHPNVKLIDTNNNIITSPLNYQGNVDIIQINHYFCKTIIEFQHKVNRGRADTYFKRSVNEWYDYDINEIEDLTSLNFFKNK
jgi:hypothetical protein